MSRSVKQTYNYRIFFVYSPKRVARRSYSLLGNNYSIAFLAIKDVCFYGTRLTKNAVFAPPKWAWPKLRHTSRTKGPLPPLITRAPFYLFSALDETESKRCVKWVTSPKPLTLHLCPFLQILCLQPKPLFLHWCPFLQGHCLRLCFFTVVNNYYNSIYCMPLYKW